MVPDEPGRPAGPAWLAGPAAGPSKASWEQGARSGGAPSAGASARAERIEVARECGPRARTVAISAVLGSVLGCSPCSQPCGCSCPRSGTPRIVVFCPRPLKGPGMGLDPRIRPQILGILYLFWGRFLTFCPGSEGYGKKCKRSPLFSCARGQKRRQMRPRHSHSEPDSEPPGLIFSSSAAQEVNLSIGAQLARKTCCQSTTKPRKIGVLGVPPSTPPYPRTRVSRPRPEIDLKSFGGAYALSPASWGP